MKEKIRTTLATLQFVVYYNSTWTVSIIAGICFLYLMYTLQKGEII